MTFTHHAVRTAIPSITTDTLSLECQCFRRPSNCGRNILNMTRNLGKHRIIARPPLTAFKHVESSPCIKDTNLFGGDRQAARTMYGLPCLTMCRHTWFKGRQRDGKDKRRRSSIVRCEEEHFGCGECKCNKQGCEGKEHGELREWKGMRDAYSEYTRQRAEESDQAEDAEWKGSLRDAHPEYTPSWNCEHEDEGRVSSSLSVANKGYVIKVSKELMGLFCYIEKRKRSMIKELAYTLRQVAAVALILTSVRGIFSPLVEVFRTTPPTWSKLLLMLASLDSIAVCYLTIKSAEPLEQLAALATENRPDIMEGVEKEEEMILKIATEFIRLFKRLRNIAISITVSQTAQLIFTVLRLKDPNFVLNCTRVVQTWMQTPWT